MVQIDEIGVLFVLPMADAQGQLTQQPAALPGWHVNATRAVPGWEAWRAAPATPRRVFAGVETVFYTFPSPGVFNQALATAVLDIPEPVRVPGSISMAQAQQALLQAGLLDTVEAGILTMPRSAQIDWQHRQTVERHSPLVTALAAALGLDDTALDALFLLGATQ